MKTHEVPKSFTHQLWWIIAGTKGGKTRAKIILALKEQPSSANHLTELLKLDYKTIRYHLDILSDNKLLTTAGKKYGLMYFISPELESLRGRFCRLLISHHFSIMTFPCQFCSKSPEKFRNLEKHDLDKESFLASSA